MIRNFGIEGTGVRLRDDCHGGVSTYSKRQRRMGYCANDDTIDGRRKRRSKKIPKIRK